MMLLGLHLGDNRRWDDIRGCLVIWSCSGYDWVGHEASKFWLLLGSPSVAMVTFGLPDNRDVALHRELIVVVARWHSTRGIVPVQPSLLDKVGLVFHPLSLFLRHSPKLHSCKIKSRHPIKFKPKLMSFNTISSIIPREN